MALRKRLQTKVAILVIALATVLAFQNCGEQLSGGFKTEASSVPHPTGEADDARPPMSFSSLTVGSPLTTFRPQVRSYEVSANDILVIKTDSPDELADVWIKSPANGLAKMLRDVPVTGGRITLSLPAIGMSSDLVSDLSRDGLMVFVFQKNTTSYLNSPVIAHRQLIGVWNSFYKRTQIQGHLAGSANAFLRGIPNLLTSSTLSFPYVPRRSGLNEIPFTGKFTINRILGGYRPDWFPAGEDYKSRDLVVMESGSLRYRIEVLIRNLNIYREAGYSLSDITLALENVPWDISKTTCSVGSGAALGEWGNRAAPRSMALWGSLIREVATGLRSAYGEEANLLRFKMGSEYNGLEAFCGTQSEYFDMYATAAREIKKILPSAEFMPGEFAGSLTNSNVKYIELFNFAKSQNLPFNGLARSCHYLPYLLQDSSTTFTSGICGRDFAKVYAGDPSVSPRTLSHEIHQFGMLGERDIGDAGKYTDFGPRGAAWHFMTAVKLKKLVDLRWLAHWDLGAKVGNYQNPVISGTWWLYQVYERLNGLHFQDLIVSAPAPSPDKEAFATAFYGPGKLYVVVASFNPRIDEGRTTEDIRLVLPRSLLPTLNPSLPLDLDKYKLSMVEMKNTTAPVNMLRDLIASGAVEGVSLARPFAANEDLLPKPSQMIESTDRADLSRKMYALGTYIETHPAFRENFEASVQSLFKLTPGPTHLTVNSLGQLILTSKSMEPSHVRVIEIKYVP